MAIFQIKRKIFTLVACFPAHIRYSNALILRPKSPESARNVPEFARNTYKFPLKRPKYISGTFRALGTRARKIRPNSPEIYFGRSKYDVRNWPKKVSEIKIGVHANCVTVIGRVKQNITEEINEHEQAEKMCTELAKRRKTHVGGVRP